MPTVATPPDLTRLAELGALLRSCRDIYLTMFAAGFHEPSTTAPSEAWADFQTIHTGPAGMWPLEFSKQPRSTAVKLLHQQADYCYALGLLVEAPEVRDPVALVRSIVEFGCRGFWILHPDADHRTRCIRAYLLELVSVLHSIPAYKVAPHTTRDAAETELKARFQKAKSRAADLFHAEGTNLEVGFAKWTVEGEKYASWTDITEAWADAHDLGVDGRALYELLALGAHPQGFSATIGLTFDADGTGTRVFTVAQVERQVRIAIASFYYALVLVANYGHQRTEPLLAWEDQMLAVLPNPQTTPDT